MARLLVWALLGYIIYKMFLSRKATTEVDNKKPAGEETHKDPVCGVYVSADDAVIGRVEDQRIYFCSMACLEKYREQIENK